MKGRRTFDYSNANGIIEIGSGDALFEAKWSRAGGDSIHIYNDPPSIEAIALAADAAEISDIRDAARFDYTSRTRTPRERQVVLLRNSNSLYAALKIIDVKAVGHGDAVDEVTFDYVILNDGTRDFSNVANIVVVDNTFSKRLLLVGAGFSKNWGGLLASEVSGRILSHRAVASRRRLRELLQREPSFEDALERTRTGLYEAADAEAMERAIGAAFDDMDAEYRNPGAPVLGATINDFIARFCPGPVGVGTGYVFSLNQDLLLERIYGIYVDKQPLVTPGVRWHEPPPRAPAAAYPIPLASTLDPAADPPLVLRNFNLIKLHGSTNWRSSDGLASMVIGRRKPLTIARSPLLGWYHRVFERVLFDGDVRLMVIGYGWGDEHINAPIAEAVRNYGLQIYSWNTTNPTDLLRNAAEGSDILNGIMGYLARPLTEVMPNNPMRSETADYRSIIRDFF